MIAEQCLKPTVGVLITTKIQFNEDLIFGIKKPLVTLFSQKNKNAQFYPTWHECKTGRKLKISHIPAFEFCLVCPKLLQLCGSVSQAQYFLLRWVSQTAVEKQHNYNFTTLFLWIFCWRDLSQVFSVDIVGEPRCERGHVSSTLN